MNNTGSADSSPDAPAEDSVVRLPLRLLLLGAGALLLAIIVGSQVIGILVGILFPPTPPLPDGVSEISHQSEAPGVDEWLYEIAQSPCDVLAYYQKQGGVCRVAPFACQGQAAGSVPTPAGSPGEHLARCTGQLDFSIFTMRWQVIIASGRNPQSAEFRLVRETLWTGGLPRTPAPG